MAFASSSPFLDFFSPYQRDEMVDFVRPEHGEGLSVHVGIPQTPGLDNGPDVLALGLELALEDPGGPPLGHLGETLRRVSVVVPYPARKMSRGMTRERVNKLERCSFRIVISDTDMTF